MKHRTTRVRILSLCFSLIVAVAIVGCGDRSPQPAAQKSAAASGWPRTIRDGAGESMTLDAPPQRIVSQTLGTDEILFAICPVSRIVGLSTMARDGAYSHVVEEAKKLNAPPIDTVETAVSLKPDLVFVASYSRAELVDLLRSSGTRVFRFSSFSKVDDIIGHVRTIGHAIGEDAAAERVIAGMQSRLTRVRERAAASGRHPRVMSYDPLGYSASGGTLFDDVIKTVGAVNVTAEKGLTGFQGFARLSAEQVLQWNPEYLIVGAKPGEEAIMRQRLLADPAIAATTAMKEGRVIVMDTRDFLTTSHLIVRTVESLADRLYGTVPATPTTAAGVAQR